MLQRRKSSVTSIQNAMKLAGSPVKRKSSVFVMDGKVASSQHLLALQKDKSDAVKEKLAANASNLYLPEQKRNFVPKKVAKKKSFPTAQMPKEAFKSSKTV